MARKTTPLVLSDTGKAFDDAIAQNSLSQRDVFGTAILGVVSLARCYSIALRGTPTGLGRPRDIRIDHFWSENALVS